MIYLGGAAGYAVLSAIPVAAIVSAGYGRFWRRIPLFLAGFFLVFLAIYPFPDAAGLVCPVAGASPQLVPGRFLQPMAELWKAGVPFQGWLTNIYVASTVMNFIVCCMIGAAWAWWGKRSLAWAAAFGFSLSLAIELTQLSGLWGFYRCAYRQFDVDDLILNVLGVLSGFAAWRWACSCRPA